MKASRAGWAVWLLALGYFLCYAVYSGLIKHVTHGVKDASGLLLLPSVTLGTALTLPLLVAALGWWRCEPRWDRNTVVSGIATGIIIVTTTLAYTFDGISIVFALLLLRGGVLILAPIVDLICGREVRGVCWLALLGSLAAIVVALANSSDVRMTIVAALNTCAYLAAYAVRLPRMTRCAKVADKELTRSWFIGEMTIAITIQLLLPLLGAMTPGLTGARLRSGIVDINAMGVLIGAFYGGLYFFGTTIYLNRRENSFCIPLNRGASLLAGVTAAIVIGKPPTLSELSAVLLVVGALLLLSPAHHLSERVLAAHFARWRRRHVQLGLMAKRPTLDGEGVQHLQENRRSLLGGKPGSYRTPAGRRRHTRRVTGRQRARFGVASKSFSTVRRGFSRHNQALRVLWRELIGGSRWALK